MIEADLIARSGERLCIAQSDGEGTWNTRVSYRVGPARSTLFFGFLGTINLRGQPRLSHWV